MLELADNDILIFNIAFGTFGKVSGEMKRKTLGCYSETVEPLVTKLDEKV